MSDHILVEQDGPIATVVFNRPKMRNAISLAMWSEIAAVTDRLSKDDSVRAIVYRGAGTDAFASGADISEFQENRKDTATALNYNQQTEAAYSAIRDVPQADRRDDLRLLHGRRDGARDGRGLPLRGGGLEVRHPGRAAQHHLRARSGRTSSWTWWGRPTPRTSSTRRARVEAEEALAHRLHPAPGARGGARGVHLRLPEEGRGQRAALGAGDQGPGRRPSSRASPTPTARTSAPWASRRSTARTTRKARGPSSRSGRPGSRGGSLCASPFSRRPLSIRWRGAGPSSASRGSRAGSPQLGHQVTLRPLGRRTGFHTLDRWLYNAGVALRPPREADLVLGVDLDGFMWARPPRAAPSWRASRASSPTSSGTSGAGSGCCSRCRRAGSGATSSAPTSSSCTSRYSAAVAQREYGVPLERIAVVPEPIDLEVWDDQFWRAPRRPRNGAGGAERGAHVPAQAPRGSPARRGDPARANRRDPGPHRRPRPGVGRPLASPRGAGPGRRGRAPGRRDARARWPRST